MTDEMATLPASTETEQEEKPRFAKVIPLTKAVSSLDVPKSWKMKTPQGNQAMQRKGQSLVNGLEKAKKKNANLSEYIHVFEKYLNSYVRSVGTITCKDGGDKKVKSQVKAFLKKSAKAYNVDENTIETIWEKTMK